MISKKLGCPILAKMRVHMASNFRPLARVVMLVTQMRLHMHLVSTMTLDIWPHCLIFVSE